MIGSVLHFLQYNYAPASGPWYSGATWGNVFVVAILAPAGWLWSRTRFWPLRPLERMHAHLAERIHHVHERLDAHEDLHAGHTDRLDAIQQQLEQLHGKLDALDAKLPERRRRSAG